MRCLCNRTRRANVWMQTVFSEHRRHLHAVLLFERFELFKQMSHASVFRTVLEA